MSLLLGAIASISLIVGGIGIMNMEKAAANLNGHETGSGRYSQRNS
jgi:hypothetical protein